MAKKESTYYNREIRKAGNYVDRPNEIIKRPYGDGNMKLTFKSPDFYERDLIITNKAMLSQSQKTGNVKTIDVVSSGTTIDLNNTTDVILNMSTGTTITSIENFKNGVTYDVFIVQDEIGGHSLNIDNSLNYVTTFGDLNVDTTANSITILKFICVNNKIFIEIYKDYNLIN